MPRPASDKRARLADAALELAYQHGFERTSIADIAAHAGVASGSVYYYFKTKDDVGQAVLDQLSVRYRAAFDTWRELPRSEDRLVAFVDLHLEDLDDVRAFGCPLGSITAQLATHSTDLGVAAGRVVTTLIDWAAGQFADLGFTGPAARARATHLIAVMQGAAALSRLLDDPEPLQREAAHLERWIRRTAE